MKKWIGNKNFYRKVLLITMPIFVQNGISSFVGMLDNLMVGRLGTDALNGVAIVNQFFFVFMICIFGGVSGAGIFSAQFFGKKDYEGVRNAFRFKLIACTVISVLAIVLLATKGDFLIQLYLHKESGVGDLAKTLEYAQTYLWVMLIGLVPFAMSQVYASTLREGEITMTPMIASAIGVLTNFVFNLLLIFGYLGFPKLGVLGAAIATLIARIVEMLIIVVSAHKGERSAIIMKGIYRTIKIPMILVKRILLKGLPLMINEILWVVGMVTITQCYSNRGLEVVASLNITSTISNMFNIAYIALGSGISIMVGQLLGAGKLDEAKDTDRKLVAFSVFMSMVLGSIMILCSRVFPEFYKTEQEVKELAKMTIIIAGIYLPLQAYTHAAYFTLRAGGKTGYTFLFDSIFTWVLIIPLAYILSTKTTLPVILVYALVQGTEFIKCIIGFVMLKSDKWMINFVDEIHY